MISTNSDTILPQQNPKILNAMMSMSSSGIRSDAPIINIFELIKMV